MPKFQVKDQLTGKTVTVEGDKAPTQADAEQIFHQAGLRQQQPTLQDKMQSQWNNPVAGAVNFLAPAIKTNEGVIANQLDYQRQQPNAAGNLPQAISNAAGATGHLVSQLPGAAVSDALTIAGGAGAKQLLTHPVGSLKAVGGALKTGSQYLTKKGVVGITNKAVSQATQAGKTMQWDDLANEIRKEVGNSLGNTAQVNKSLNQLLAEKSPAGLRGLPETMAKTPQELLDWRRQITARGAGKGVFQNLFKGSDIEDKVSSVARRVISNNIHKIAPESKHADKAFSIYKKIGGSPAELLGKIAAYEAFNNTIGKNMPPEMKYAIDALIGLKGVNLH